MNSLYTKSSSQQITHGIAGGWLLQPIPKVVLMLVLSALGIGATFFGGFKMAILLICAIVIVPPVLAIVWKTKIGIYFLITASFFLSVALRLVPQIPIGLSIDFMILLMLIGKLFKIQYGLLFLI